LYDLAADGMSEFVTYRWDECLPNFEGHRVVKICMDVDASGQFEGCAAAILEQTVLE
jgi:hypothetical protein